VGENMDDLSRGKKGMIAQEIREAIANLFRGGETLHRDWAFDTFLIRQIF